MYTETVADATINFLDYAEQHGFALVKVHIDAKRPAGDDWPNLSSTDPAEWRTWKTLSFNLGVHAGKSRLITIDLDTTKEGGREGAWKRYSEWCQANGLPVYAPHVSTARHGMHIYFQLPEGVDAKALKGGIGKLGAGIDVLVGNKQSIAAGSYYDGTAKGEDSGWYTLISDAPPHPAPAALIEHCTPKQSEAASAPVEAESGRYDFEDAKALYQWMADNGAVESDDDWRNAGMAAKSGFGEAGIELWEILATQGGLSDESLNRWRSFKLDKEGGVGIGTLLKLAHGMGWKGQVRQSTAKMFGAVAQVAQIAATAGAQLPPPLPYGIEVLPPANAVSLMTRGEAVPSDTEDALALSFADVYIDELRYCPDLGRWLKWDGTRWRPDKTAATYDLIRKHLRKFAGGLAYQDARKIANAKTVAAIETLARRDQRLVITADMLDSDIWLLNTPGGTIDLRTGKTRPGLPGDHMSKSTAVTPGGECPKFRAFLDRAMGGDVEMVAFLQRLFGYALTGSTREDVIAFLHGPGRNGKGVFLHTVASLLGEYAKTTRIETFLESQFDRHPTDEAALAGARLVTSDEIPPGRRWDEAKLKRYSGGEPINARFMRQDPFEYQPQMLLTFSANNRPRLQTVDEAIRSRMLLIPFSVVIPKSRTRPYAQGPTTGRMAGHPGVVGSRLPCMAAGRPTTTSGRHGGYRRVSFR